MLGISKDPSAVVSQSVTLYSVQSPFSANVSVLVKAIGVPLRLPLQPLLLGSYCTENELLPVNTLLPKVGASPSNITLVRLKQFTKAPVPIDITLSGMVMLVRLVQPANATDPIEVTLSGMVTLVIPKQFWNA